MARRSKSQQNAQRNARIMFAILAILVVMTMVLSLVATPSTITPVVNTPAAQQSAPLPIATP
jgi:hypothetical protein